MTVLRAGRVAGPSGRARSMPPLGRWILLCAAAETVGMTAAASVARLADTWFGPPRTGREAAAALGLVVVGGLVEGTALGLAQASGLRSWLSSSGRRRAWVLVTVTFAGLGWAGASAPAVLGADDAAGAPPLPLVLAGAAGLGVALGIVLGAVQAPVLRDRVSHPWRWVGASAAGWALAMPVIFLGATLPSASWPTGPVVALGALTGAVAGVVLGAVTGRFFPALVGEPAARAHRRTGGV